MNNVQQIFTHIWNVFVTSNLFNFVIFIALFTLIFKKINLSGMLAGIHQKIVNIIEMSKREHEEATAKLKDAESSVANLGKELDTIINDAEKSADVICEKIMEEAKKQLESIEANAKKVIEAEEKLIIADVTKKTSKASIQVAKSHIEKTLQENPTLHEKYINESIDELDRLSF